MSLIKCLDQLLNAAIKFDGKHNTQTSNKSSVIFIDCHNAQPAY